MRAKLGILWGLAKKRPLLAMMALLLMAVVVLVGIDSLSARSKSRAKARSTSGSLTAEASADSHDGFDTGLSAGDVHRNLSKGYGERVVGVEDKVSHLNKEIEGLRKDVSTLTKQNEEKDRALQELLQFLKDAQGKTSGTNGNSTTQETALARIKKFELTVEGAGDEKKTLHIPAGSFGEATLLSGVYAPTSGEALPVLIKLDAALIGPSKTKIPLKGVFLIGKATGDANSSRATIQLHTLSVVKSNGEAIEIPVNGWAIDSDGIQGVRGQYVWRADEILTLSSVASGASAFADAFAARETTNQLTPLGGVTSALTGDPVKFAGFRALSGMSEQISELVIARMKEIQPAVYAGNGKKITIAFLSGATVTGYSVEELKDASDQRPYRGLDAHK